MSDQNQSMAHTAQVATIQAQITVAINNPRDNAKVMEAVKRGCNNQRFAELALYSFPRGGMTIEGASIRLAELLARSFTNLNYGYIEIQRGAESSLLEAYAIDLQSNLKTNRIFEVPHYRDTKRGRQKLTDDRDITEQVANQAQRKVRGCILQLIPAEIVDGAVNLCKQILTSGEVKQPDLARIVQAFAKHGVSKVMLENKYGSLEGITKESLANMRVVYNSIENEEQPVEQYFEDKQKHIEPPAKKTRKPRATKPKAPVESTPDGMQAVKEPPPAEGEAQGWSDVLD